MRGLVRIAPKMAFITQRSCELVFVVVVAVCTYLILICLRFWPSYQYCVLYIVDLYPFEIRAICLLKINNHTEYDTVLIDFEHMSIKICDNQSTPIISFFCLVKMRWQTSRTNQLLYYIYGNGYNLFSEATNEYSELHSTKRQI